MRILNIEFEDGKIPRGIYSIPNMLCFYRLVYLPVMIWLFYLDYAWQPEQISWPAWTNVVLYTLAGLSDFLDGKIARLLKQETLLGKFLDSSTDKMVVGVSLMCLVAYQRLTGWWILVAIIIYLREILISGVREFLAHYNVVVRVTQVSKWKLTIQMLFIGFLIAGDYGDPVVPHALLVGKMGFLFAAVLTVWSGWDYIREGWATIKRLEAEKQAGEAKPPVA